MFHRLIGACLIMVPLPSGAQVPSPPSLPGQDELGERLVRAIEKKDVAAYAALLSDGVLVYEDGRPVARNKAEWLSMFGRKLAADGVAFKVSPGYSFTGRLLFIEYFNSAASWGGSVPAHCCWSYDAVAHDVADSRVTVMRRLTGGGRRLDRRGLPER